LNKSTNKSAKLIEVSKIQSNYVHKELHKVVSQDISSANNILFPSIEAKKDIGWMTY